MAGWLLLPLAGPDTFTEEENDSLPLDLQYLPDDKTREPEQEIRKLLLEALMQVGGSDGYCVGHLLYQLSVNIIEVLFGSNL